MGFSNHGALARVPEREWPNLEQTSAGILNGYGAGYLIPAQLLHSDEGQALHRINT